MEDGPYRDREGAADDAVSFGGPAQAVAYERAVFDVVSIVIIDLTQYWINTI